MTRSEAGAAHARPRDCLAVGHARVSPADIIIYSLKLLGLSREHGRTLTRGTWWISAKRSGYRRSNDKAQRLFRLIYRFTSTKTKSHDGQMGAQSRSWQNDCALCHVIRQCQCMSRDGVTPAFGVRTAVDGLRKSQNSASSDLPSHNNLFISVTVLCDAQPAALDIQVSAACVPRRETRPSLRRIICSSTGPPAIFCAVHCIRPMCPRIRALLRARLASSSASPVNAEMH